MKPPAFEKIHPYLDHWAVESPAREAVVSDSTRLTYAELASQVEAQAERLWELGVRPGDRVAVLSPPCPEFFVALLAVVSLGAVFQGLSPKGAKRELAFQLEDAEPALVLALRDEANAQLASEVAGSIAVRSGRDLEAVPATGRHRTAVGAASDAVVGATPAVLVYTSGTTGKPKGAVLPHRGFAICGAAQARRWLVSEGMRMPCVEPINHVAAIGDASISMLVGGGTTVYQEQFEADSLLALLAEEEIDVWYTDPAVLGLCSRSPRWGEAPLEKLTRICWSGGRASLPLVRELGERVGLRGTSWGMTETVGSLTYTDDGADDGVLSATIGRFDDAYPGRVVDEEGIEVGPGGAGELQVRGPHLMTSYWKRPEATAESFTEDGWFRSGDLVMPWDDGNLELVGRRSEMIKSGGENIYPREVEQAMEEHPAVVAAALVAQPDDLWGEVGHAFVLSDGPPVEAEELREFLRERLARFKVPKEFSFVAELPLLESGKVDRRGLRAVGAEAEAR